MAVSSHRRVPPFLAAMLLGFLVGAATCGRTTSSTTLAHSQARTNLAEDKSRLGSTPPSCHNRCDACNPCSPVQVATVPRFSSRGTRAGAADGEGVSAYGQYSNYKPVGWKCVCAGRLYNP